MFHFMRPAPGSAPLGGPGGLRQRQLIRARGAPQTHPVMKNTACTQAQGNCEASSVSCVEAMDNVDRLQREVIADLPAHLKEGVRYLDGQYSRRAFRRATTAPRPATTYRVL
ncbi:unnamed protein product [Prorocentrum cordatum]|uniref:Uncharacterized protein n=1 Tax=Prorocentrum cordatum TaxID=2364126 RepID=A0ABN9PDT1_9DINO|nr:unnamed protein product [Polarella glacialis]